MAPLRAAPGLVVLAMVLLGACKGGTSAAPPQGNSELDCLTGLDEYCCPASDRPSCVADFAAAQTCGMWAAPSKVKVHPTACHGFVAVTVTVQTYTMAYVYDAATGALHALGDDAATNAPGNLAIECGAGPTGFVFPADCAQAWLDPTQGVACATTTVTAKSLCP